MAEKDVEVVTTVRLAWRLFWDRRVPGLAKLLPLIGVAYFIFPFDIWPDVVIGVGQLDDLAVMTLAVKLFIAVCPPFIVAEHSKALAAEGKEERGREKSDNPGGPDDGNVIEGECRVIS